MMMNVKRFFLIMMICAVSLVNPYQGTAIASSKAKHKTVLKADDFKHYADYFNRMEDENIAKSIPNSASWDWMKANIPLFQCPQDNFEEIYYYRWWSLRKHITETPMGYGITEFLVDRPYADKYNLISCALGHHIMETRWLHNPVYLQDNVRIWFRGNEGRMMDKLLAFSSWTAFALYNSYLVNSDKTFLTGLLPDLVDEYRQWELEKRTPNGLFWQYDVRDGMEEQISGGRKEKNMRPTINSYMYGNAMALSKIAALNNNQKFADYYSAKADTLKKLALENLWNAGDQFFETVKEAGGFAQVREAIGYIPWYFNLPNEEHAIAWKQVTDNNGFLAPYGLTTAERRHPGFRSHGCCRCEWDGAIWPFATAQTLTGMANLLNDYQQTVVDKSDYFMHMELYVESQYHRGRPYIGEYQDETTGYWLKGDQERSRYYNHSTFNDLIITGLIGLRPRADELIDVNPLIPEGKWDWFCLDNVLYHGKTLTIIWDKTGEKYKKGKGLSVWADGKEIGRTARLEKLICQ
ncbi:MGH1-like glycoside hydrolase domain-containing protein [Gaoshiqia sp. Z1-71]|uniref:MGH1-like glycoside hydrolase domain-containing protein n=1 Tax=Gaoshiqia hydrogeniformans TaxID=3290090 RepID=UPI003BF7E648